MAKLPFQVWVLGVVSLLMDIASEMIYPLLPIFLTVVLGASTATVGLIEGVAEATSSLFKVLGGRISDRAGTRKPYLLAGYGIPALLRPILALATQPWHVLSFRFFDRVGKGFRTAPRDALLAEVASQETYGRVYGLHRAMDSLGATIGPLIAFFLLPRINYSGVFWASSIPAILAALVIIFFVKEKPAIQKKLLPLRAADLSKAYKSFLAVTLVFTLGLSSNAFLLLRLKDLGWSEAQVTLIYALYNLIYALASYPFGQIADRFGVKRVVGFGFGLYGLIYLGFGFASMPLQGLALFCAYAIYSAAFEGSSRAYLAKLIPEENKATAIGLYHTVVGFVLFPASALFGWIWQASGPTAAFVFGSSMAFLALFGFMWAQLNNASRSAK